MVETCHRDELPCSGSSTLALAGRLFSILQSERLPTHLSFCPVSCSRAGGGEAWAQTWISAVSATTIASTAKVTWTTAVPADLKLNTELRRLTDSVTAPAAANVASHSVALNGLKGGQHISLQGAFERCVRRTLSRPGLCSFDTDPGYGFAFAPDFDASRQGNATVLTLQIDAAQGTSAVLLGHSTLETGVNGLYDGMAEGYQMTAASNGTLTTLSVYRSATTATKLFVGLYSDSNGPPGTRLTGGNSAAFQKTAWNTIPVPPVSIAAGWKYWFVLLGTGGLMKFRQKPITGGWIDELSGRTLTSLPASWTTGTSLYRGRRHLGVWLGSHQH